MNGFIFGSAGFAKEVEWLISECEFEEKPTIKAFVAHSSDPAVGTSINEIPVISEDEYLKTWNQKDLHQVFIAVGAPKLKKKIFEKINNQNTLFPNLIHPNVAMDRRAGAINLGKGVIICAGVILTTTITISDFVHLNLACTVGHDSAIGSYSTLSPGVNISGNVKIGNEVFFGTGACTIEQVQVSDNVVVGAGAVVSKSLTEEGTYVGIPAKKLQKA